MTRQEALPSGRRFEHREARPLPPPKEAARSSDLAFEAAIAAGPKVTDDFPDLLAVSDSELEAIEAYLSAPIEELLGRQD